MEEQINFCLTDYKMKVVIRNYSYSLISNTAIVSLSAFLPNVILSEAAHSSCRHPERSRRKAGSRSHLECPLAVILSQRPELDEGEVKERQEVEVILSQSAELDEVGVERWFNGVIT